MAFTVVFNACFHQIDGYAMCYSHPVHFVLCESDNLLDFCMTMCLFLVFSVTDCYNSVVIQPKARP